MAERPARVDRAAVGVEDQAGAGVRRGQERAPAARAEPVLDVDRGGRERRAARSRSRPSGAGRSGSRRCRCSVTRRAARSAVAVRIPSRGTGRTRSRRHSVSEKIAVSSRGARGANASHAASASSRAPRPYEIWKNAARSTRRVRRRIAVTMPNEPPPPRSAQNRSSSPETRRRRPSAVTTSMLRTRSSVRPIDRPASPIPPPSASPPIATVGHEPAGTVTPRRASAA